MFTAPWVLAAKSAYAVFMSAIACRAAEFPRHMVPFTIPGGNALTVVACVTPRSPVTRVAPVLVIEELARTAKLAAVPRDTVDWPADRERAKVVHNRNAPILFIIEISSRVGIGGNPNDSGKRSCCCCAKTMPNLFGRVR